MASLEHRVAKLESAAPPAEPFIIVHTIVDPGGLGAPMVRIQLEDGREFIREPGEDRDTFVERCARAAGWPAHVVSLIGYPAPREDSAVAADSVR